MVEAVRATKREPLAVFDRVAFGRVLPYGLPVLMALLGLIFLMLTVQRAGLLRTWTEVYSGGGSFLVQSCDPQEKLGPDQWACQGHLITERGVDGDVALATSMGAVASHRPYVGQRLDVFFNEDERATVYPIQYRLNEMTRAYLSFLPRFLAMVGSLIWLAGWFMTRKHDEEDYVARDAVRFPQRFSWKSRGLSWIGAAAVMLVVNYFLATRIVGSLDII